MHNNNFADAGTRDIFISMRNDRNVKTIAHEIERGSSRVYKMIEDSSLQENSGALQLFLLYLKKPLVPAYIQALALGSSLAKLYTTY